jgi:hypothetical protein
VLRGSTPEELSVVRRLLDAASSCPSSSRKTAPSEVLGAPRIPHLWRSRAVWDAAPAVVLYRTLRQALAQIRYNIRQRHGYGVLVTSPTTRLSFDVMILAGPSTASFAHVCAGDLLFAGTSRAQGTVPHLREHRHCSTSATIST